MARTYYAAVTNKNGDSVRIGARLAPTTPEDSTEYVSVWITSDNSRPGLYKLERFPGGKLTQKSLEQFFAPNGD